MAQSGQRALMAATVSATHSGVSPGSSPPWSTKVRNPQP